MGGKNKALGWTYVFSRIYTFGQIILDRLTVFLSPKTHFSLSHEGVSHLKSISETGGILLGAHIGNWEIGLALLKSIQNVDTSVAMLVVQEDFLQQLIRKKQNNFLRVIPIEQGVGVTFFFKKQLEQGKLITMHGDRFMEGNRSEEVLFMNKKARFPVGPYIFAATFQKPISFVTVVKTGLTSYKFSCTKPKNYTWNRKEGRDKQLREWLEEYVRYLENQVREYPEQWLNFYDFWEQEKDKHEI